MAHRLSFVSVWTKIMSDSLIGTWENKREERRAKEKLETEKGVRREIFGGNSNNLCLSKLWF